MHLPFAVPGCVPTVTTVVLLAASAPLNVAIPQIRMLPMSSFTVVDSADSVFFWGPPALCKENAKNMHHKTPFENLGYSYYWIPYQY